MSELKPCPFCGGRHIETAENLDLVYCFDCGASAKSIVDRNTRPIEDALNARIAELEGLVDRLVEVGDRLVFPDGVFDDEQSVIERDWRILTKAVKEREE